MAGASKGSSTPGNPSGRRKRPGPPIIELTATEVPAAEAKSAEAKPAPAEPASPEQASPEGSPASGAEREQPEQAPPGGPAPTGSPEWPKAVREAAARHWTWLPTWPVAGAAGAAAMALVAAGIWLVSSSPRVDPSDALALRLALIEQQLRQLGERPVATPDARVPELAGRIGAAEQAMRRLDDISARLATSEHALRRHEDITAKLTSIEQTTRRLEGFGARLDTVEQALAAPRGNDPALADRLGASEAALKTVTERLAAVETATKAVGERLDASGAAELSERLAAVETAVRSVSERVNDIGRRLDQVRAVASEADRQAAIASEEAARADATDRAARLAFVAAALRNAVERGAPLGGELAALKPLVPENRLAPLEAFASTGVPPAAALAQELSALTPAMLSAVAPKAGDGLLDRLQVSAERLVRIRPISETPGDDPVTVIGRIEAKAARHDIDGALAELAKLPDAARAPADAWIRKAEARRAALDIAGRLAHDAFGALGKATP